MTTAWVWACEGYHWLRERNGRAKGIPDCKLGRLHSELPGLEGDEDPGCAGARTSSCLVEATCVNTCGSLSTGICTVAAQASNWASVEPQAPVLAGHQHACSGYPLAATPGHTRERPGKQATLKIQDAHEHQQCTGRSVQKKKNSVTVWNRDHHCSCSLAAMNTPPMAQGSKRSFADTGRAQDTYYQQTSGTRANGMGHVGGKASRVIGVAGRKYG